MAAGAPVAIISEAVGYPVLVATDRKHHLGGIELWGPIVALGPDRGEGQEQRDQSERGKDECAAQNRGEFHRAYISSYPGIDLSDRAIKGHYRLQVK
jgi:hypothetical protein